MKYDIITFLIFCNSVPIQDKFGFQLCSCPFEWLCTTRLIHEWTTMFYSEGE